VSAGPFASAPLIPAPERGAYRNPFVSVPTAELTARAAGAPSGAQPASLLNRLTGARLYLALAGLALLIGALSLLVPSTPSYDPWAWLVWGREIVHLKLHTTGGPSWKPLPLVFTTLFAPFGKAAPDLWLMVARAGAVMALAMVFKVSVRLTQQLGDTMRGAAAGTRATASGARAALGGLPGTVLAPALLAGLVATAGLLNSRGFISDNALGYSEGLMTALVLVAVDRHLDGQRRQAFAVGFFAALDRPEIWLFWGPYGLWLWWTDPGARKLVAALFVLIPVFWFLPEYLGSHHFFRGVSRAQHPRSNSPAFAKCPFCSELGTHAWRTVLLRVKVIAAVAVVLSAGLLWRQRRARAGWTLASPRERAQAGLVLTGVLGLAWWIVIALMTQAGFSGNDRYLVLGAALVLIAGGTGWGWAALELGRLLPRYAGPVRALGARAPATGIAVLLAAVLLVLPNWIGGNVIDLQRSHRALVYQAHLRGSAAAAVAKLGGAGRIFACGTVMTEGFQVPLLAWTLGAHILQVQAAPVGPGTPPPAPNVIFQTRAQHHAHLLPLLSTWPGTHYKLVLPTKTFRVYEHCAG